MAIGSPGAAFITATALTLTSAVSLTVYPNKFNKGIRNSRAIIPVAGLAPVCGLVVSSATRTPFALAMLTPEVLIVPSTGEYWT